MVPTHSYFFWEFSPRALFNDQIWRSYFFGRVGEPTTNVRAGGRERISLGKVDRWVGPCIQPLIVGLGHGNVTGTQKRSLFRRIAWSRNFCLGGEWGIIIESVGMIVTKNFLQFWEFQINDLRIKTRLLFWWDDGMLPALDRNLLQSELVWISCPLRVGKESNLPSLKLTATAPENGWLEYFLVSFWEFAYFQVLLLLVSGSVSSFLLAKLSSLACSTGGTTGIHPFGSPKSSTRWGAPVNRSVMELSIGGPLLNGHQKKGYIYLEPQWPLFLKVNPPKQGPFQSTQGSFGFRSLTLISSGMNANPLRLKHLGDFCLAHLGVHNFSENFGIIFKVFWVIYGGNFSPKKRHEFSPSQWNFLIWGSQAS